MNGPFPRVDAHGADGLHWPRLRGGLAEEPRHPARLPRRGNCRGAGDLSGRAVARLCGLRSRDPAADERGETQRRIAAPAARLRRRRDGDRALGVRVPGSLCGRPQRVGLAAFPPRSRRLRRGRGAHGTPDRPPGGLDGGHDPPAHAGARARPRGCHALSRHGVRIQRRWRLRRRPGGGLLPDPHARHPRCVARDGHAEPACRRDVRTARRARARAGRAAIGPRGRSQSGSRDSASSRWQPCCSASR